MGLNNVVQGGKRTQKREIHFSAPMMRLTDGRTINEFVNGEMVDSAERNAPAPPAAATAPQPAVAHQQAQGHDTLESIIPRLSLIT